ncbi:MAG: hypothetical protein COC23_06195, partial [Hyphomicrobiales bacterium]
MPATDNAFTAKTLNQKSDDATYAGALSFMRRKYSKDLSGVDAVVMSVAVGPGPRTPEGDAQAHAIANEKLAAVLKLVNDASESVVLARSASEIEAAQTAGKVALILGFQNARSLEGNVSTLDAFYAAGVRVFGL